MAETQANHVTYQKAHITDNETPTIVGVYVLGYVLAVTAVSLRLWSRKISRLPYLADDWVIIVALIIFTALFGVDIWHVVGGQLGKHAIRVSPAEVTVFLKSLYVFNPLYTNIIPLVKISILLLYTRLFPLDSVYRIIYVLIGILVCFEISTTLVDIFGCWPIEAAWNKTIPTSRCVVPQTLYMATAGINLATDIIILCIPMPLVWGLRLSTKRKIAISFIFILGALVCVTTIFRIATFHNINSYDLTWSYIDAAYWTYSELVLSFVCACIPTFRPVLNNFSSNISKFLSNSSLSRLTNRSRDSSKATSDQQHRQHPQTTFNGVGMPRQAPSKAARATDSDGFEMIEDSNFLETTAYSEKDKGRKSGKEDDLEMAIPAQGIHVQKDVHQTN